MRKSILMKLAAMMVAVLFAFPSYAQKISVVGSVSDADTQESLIGVSIMEKGTTNGTMTDFDGNFNISVDKNATLTFSYVGYKSIDVEVNGQQNIEVAMQSTTAELEELVVIGYGVQRKSDITGSISSISGKDVNDVPVSSALQALQGKAAGVNIIQNTGAPGSQTTIKIRGTGTVNDADPLYVVDGFIVDNIDYLNPGDIANVEVFKDAASSAVYGARAANGVVSITTKTGQEGKTRITFDSYVGISNPWKKIDVMGVEDYALMTDYINGLNDYSVDGKLYYSKNPDGSLYFDDAKFHRVDTIRRNSPRNWWDAITRTGFKQNYNLSVSGGNEKTKFIVSANYFKENGFVETSSYQRFNVRANINHQLASWLNMQASMAYSNEDQHAVPEGQNSVLKKALYQNPLIYTYDSKGYWSEDHPLAMLDRNHERIRSDRFDMNLSLTANIGKLLTYQFKASYYLVPETNNNFTEVQKLDEDFTMPGDLTTVYKRQNRTDKWEVNNLLTFHWNNDVHDVTVLAGQTAEGYKNSWQESTKKGTASNNSNDWYLSSGYTGDKTYGLDTHWSAVGFIGRVNYNILDRYLFQANVRADASSVFAKDNRWGIFPSVSAGWKFSSESFMEDATWLSLGKLRVGWGILGNNRIDELSRYTTIANNYNYAFGVGNHILYPGATSVTIGNPDIKWEKAETFNVGLDLGFLENSLSMSVEYFNKETTDMLLRVPTVLSAGLDEDAYPMTNAGSVRNWGIEYNVSYRNQINKFRYEVGFNVSWMKNEVTSLGTGNEPIWGSYLSEGSIVDYVTKTEVGRPIGSFYGYVTDGIFQTYEEVRQSAQYEPGKNDWEQTTRPGDFRFKDLNGDGQITAEDRTYLGSPLPDFVFGIPIQLSYGNFDLNIFFQGQTGNEIFNVMDYYLYNAADGNVYADIRERHWSGQINEDRAFFPLNTDTNIPDLDPSDAARNFRASDFLVQDGSYIRLKELRLTYNFPGELVKKWRRSNLAVSFSAYNVLTFTGYDGLDPEVGKVVGTESNNLSMGVDHGNYPQARSFMIGLKLGL